MVTSAFFFCLMTVFVKIAGNQLPTMQIIFVRGLTTLLFTFFLIRKKKVFLWGKNKKILILRGIVGSVALLFVYESIQRFSLSEATVIQYLFPIFTALFATIFISEKIGKRLFYAIILGFIGVYIILNFPFFNPDASLNKLNVMIAVIGALLTGLAYVLVRLASNMKESPYVIMFYFPLFTVPLSFPFAFAEWISPGLNLWIILILVGISTQLGQTFLTFGYKALPASKAAPISYIQVPFAAISGMIIFGENITFNFLIGSVIIFFSILLLINVSDKNKKK